MAHNLVARVAGSMRASAEHLLDRAGTLLPALAAAAVVLLLFWGLAALTHRVAQVAGRHISNLTQRDLLLRGSYYVVWVIGAFVALDVAGVDARGLATGLGLGGVALGFALKDILSNLVSGLLILATRTFQIDDQIVVGETEGTVERIEVRATHIRTYDGRLVLVPNGEVFTSRVTNNTASPRRRASVFVYLDYSQDPRRAMSVILDTIAGVAGVAAEPCASVRLRDLSPAQVQVEARFWTDSHRTDFVLTASSVRLAILQALTRADISLPNPDQRRVTIVERVT